MSALHTKKAVIFDMDGVLIDSEVVLRAAWQRAAREAGYEISDSLYPRLIGLPPQSVRQILLRELGAEFPHSEVRQQRIRYAEEHFEKHGIAAKDGALELLRELEEQQTPVAVATSSPTDRALTLLEQAGLIKHLPAVIGGEQIENGKPAPDIFLAAARRIEAEPSCCIVIEDSPAGIEGAARARMTAIMVPDLALPTAETTEFADYVCSSLREAGKVIDQL